MIGISVSGVLPGASLVNSTLNFFGIESYLPTELGLNPYAGSDANGNPVYGAAPQASYGSGFQTGKLTLSLDWYNSEDHPIAISAVGGIGVIFYTNESMTELTGFGFGVGFGASFLKYLGFAGRQDYSIEYQKDIEF